MEILLKKLIQQSFEETIVNELINKYENLNLHMNKEKYIELVYIYIKEYDKEIEFTKVKGNKYISREMFKGKINKCHARLWNNGYECQCSNKIIDDNLCKKHINMLEKYKVLRFGYINEPLPRHDLINYNSLKWKSCKNI